LLVKKEGGRLETDTITMIRPHIPYAFIAYRNGVRLHGYSFLIIPERRNLSLPELEAWGVRATEVHNSEYPDNPADEYRILYTDDPAFGEYDENEVPLD
jgi:hypothetical protein